MPQQDNRPLTIVLVCDAVGNAGNGTSNSALQFARGLRALGHRVRFVGIGSRDYPAAEEWIPLVSPIAARQQMQFARPDEALFRRAFAGADIIHCYLPFSFARRAVMTARSMGIPATAGFHLQPENILYTAWPLRLIPHADRIIYSLERRSLYSRITHVHAPSRMIADQLRRNGYTNVLHVFSNGYDPRFTPAVDEGEHRAADMAWEKDFPQQRHFRIVASGRLTHEKDQTTLLRAVALSRHKRDIDVRVCGTGPLAHELEAQARLLGVSAKIGFVPHDRLVDVLRGADLFVHPSIVDIESISALEAIACGLVPVIASAPLSAAGQFALDDRSLYPVRDARALAGKIDWWIDHPEERRAMSPRYARYAREEFSLRTSVDRFVAMEREAIADFHAGRR